MTAAIAAYESSTRPPYLERIPVRRRDEIIILPVAQIASIVAEGELLHLTTVKNERHTITYRLKDLEARLDPARFIRLGRGTLANIDLIAKVNVMPGGTHVALLVQRAEAAGQPAAVADPPRTVPATLTVTRHRPIRRPAAIASP